MPVSSTAKATTCGGVAEHRVIGAPALRGEIDAHVDVALRGELEGIGEQVLEDLLQALRVAVHERAAARRRTATWNGRFLASATCRKLRSTVSRRPAKGISSTSTVTVPDSIFDRSRMSLMRLSRSEPEEWMLRANSTCFGGEIAGGVFGELLAEDEDGVERRAQLVRHVGEELGLVLRGERQLGGLFLERAAGLLDLGVLALDLGVLLGEQLGLCAQLFVGLLEFALAGLQLDGELLRLREQALGAHRRFDGVEHDADALRELLEEGRG